MELKTLDLNKWCSKSYLADKLDVRLNRVCNWAARGRIETLAVPELNMVLVRNVNSISELGIRKKIQKKVRKKFV